jgi:hypothetical protein
VRRLRRVLTRCVDEAHICEELESAVESLTPNTVLAIAGD